MSGAVCPVCGGGPVQPFLTREGFPAHQNLLLDDPEAARRTARGDLRLALCPACGFVHNTAFDPARLAYGEAYDNTQSCSPAFDAYLAELSRHLVRDCGVCRSRIVEVGCGKGGFLRRLVEADPENTGVGFDPTYVGPDEDLGGRLRFERRFYGPECAQTPADVVVCRHVIEHVPDPVGLLGAVRGALSHAPGARVFFETPCLEWILRHKVVWDFFYEHCSYFTAGSLSEAFTRAGFSVASVRHVFGGQYLFLEAVPVRGWGPARRSGPGGVPELALEFARAEAALVARWGRLVEARAAAGPVALWGAGAKGVTLANMVDPGCERLRCVVDLNPNKQGRYLPGTGHPIVDYRELGPRGVRTALLTNPNYREESAALLSAAGLRVDLVDLMDEAPAGARGEGR